ncbi:MAG: hypothetical protein KDD52_04695 [Bdellovibrionales bacterium]|nr:hypothetical protein [Bdellovibrionales bacterium]
MMKKLGLGLMSMVMLVCADGAVAQDFKVGDRIDVKNLMVAGDHQDSYTVKRCEVDYLRTNYTYDGTFFTLVEGTELPVRLSTEKISPCVKTLSHMIRYKIQKSGTVERFISASIVLTDAENNTEITLNIEAANKKLNDTTAKITEVADNHGVAEVSASISLHPSAVLKLLTGSKA